MIGYLCCSLAGHDKGKLYYILKEEADAFLVCDGDIRPLEKPKKKNKKHVQVIKVNLAEKPFEIKKVGEDNGNSGEKETVHENTDNSDEQA